MEKEKELVTLVDVGSNTVRCCAYRVNAKTGNTVKVLDARDAVGLAAYVSNEGVMSKEGAVACKKAVSKMVRMADLLNSDRTYVFATAAIRNCVNSKEIVSWVSSQCNCPIQVLSGEEEAQLSMLGASLSTGIRSGLFFDLGGGSTELSAMEGGKLIASDSIPVGSLSSWVRDSSGPWPSSQEIDAIGAGFTELIKTAKINVKGYSTLCGVGGSVRLVLKVAKQMGLCEEKSRVLSLSMLDRIIDAGKSNSDELMRLVIQIKPERIHTFLPGCAIVRAIFKEAGVTEMVVSKAGLREGFLVSRVCTDLASGFDFV